MRIDYPWLSICLNTDTACMPVTPRSWLGICCTDKCIRPGDRGAGQHSAWMLTLAPSLCSSWCFSSVQRKRNGLLGGIPKRGGSSEQPPSLNMNSTLFFFFIFLHIPGKGRELTSEGYPLTMSLSERNKRQVGVSESLCYREHRGNLGSPSASSRKRLLTLSHK